MKNIRDMTPEQRAEMRAVKDAKLKAMQEAASGFKQDFLDASFWRELASERGIKMPAWYYPCQPRFMKRYLKRLKIPVQLYLDWAAEKNLRVFAQRNPTWPLWAYVGLLLETDWEEAGHVSRQILDEVDAVNRQEDAHPSGVSE